MTLAERLYRILLLLYPKKHRQAYQRPMLQHARDLSRAARQHGRWHIAMLCLRLLKDGVVNAGIEHMEAIVMTNNGFKPVPWLSVLLACLPGLLVLFSRQNSQYLASLLSILGYFYLGLLVIAIPVIWWQKRRFPVWALLPAGALTWFLIYLAGTELSGQMNFLPIFNLKWIGIGTGIALINIVLAAAIFVVLLRGQRIPRSAWLVFAIILFGNFVLAFLYSFSRNGGDQLLSGMSQYFTSSGIGPLEGLMMVAVGLLAARQHGVLALLFVIGGFSYMVLDSDYLFGYPFREWTGLSAYIAAAIILYLVAVPVALLRAKTGLGRALAVFVPLVAFHIVRLTMPLLVIQQPLTMRPGDVIASINIVLSLVLAWILYSHIGSLSRETQPGDEPIYQTEARLPTNIDIV